IAKVFNVTIDELLHADLTKRILIQEKPAQNVAFRPVVVTVDELGQENIVLVDTKAAAGYPTRYLEPEYYRELPAFKLPGSDYRNGTFRCFQVDGDSMQDTIQHGDFVVGRFCDNHFKDVRDGYIHVVVTNDNVLVKRIISRAESEHKLYLISDNDAYPEIVVDIDDVREIWFVKSKISSYMPVKKNDLDKVIGDLTMQVHLLKSRIDQLEKN
ncbi:MAG TPA: S24 family peptidase, partial [Chitinophagales bacterium]|nr:S24 family peptidase [Chitinophagales bacterium]